MSDNRAAEKNLYASVDRCAMEFTGRSMQFMQIAGGIFMSRNDTHGSAYRAILSPYGVDNPETTYEIQEENNHGTEANDPHPSQGL